MLTLRRARFVQFKSSNRIPNISLNHGQHKRSLPLRMFDLKDACFGKSHIQDWPQITEKSIYFNYCGL